MNTEPSGPRLLVVDDEPNIAELLTIWFEPLGWTVHTAATGPQAVAMAARFDPDVVILDLMLPGLSGLDVLVRLRRFSIPPSVLMVTARDADGDRAACLGAGADAYMPKPFSLVELDAVIHNLLVTSRRSRPPGPAAAVG